MLTFGVFSQAQAEYIPNESYGPVWIGTEEEPVEGPDYSDFDGDTLANWLENFYGTDVWNYDSDSDGLPDGWETTHGLNALAACDRADDPDGDYILNIEEYQRGSDPQSWNDFWSVMGYPLDSSTLIRQNDGTESDADWDSDGSSNLDELLAGSDPRVGNNSEVSGSPQENTEAPSSNEENGGNTAGDSAPPTPSTNEPPPPPAPEPPPPVPEPLPPLPEPSPPVSDPIDLPWYEDVWNGITNFVETLFWSPAPVDAATFNALEGTASLVDPLTERQQAIQGMIENVDNAATTGATNSADPADYSGSNGTVEPN